MFLGTAADTNGATGLPSVVEVKMECFHHQSGGTQAVKDQNLPFLLLLLADGTFLAYRAFHTPRGRVCFKRLSLPAHAHCPPQDRRSKTAAPSSSMTRFDGLGESREHVNRCAYAALRQLAEHPLISQFEIM